MLTGVHDQNCGECEHDCGVQCLGWQSMAAMFVDHGVFREVESGVDSGREVTVHRLVCLLLCIVFCGEKWSLCINMYRVC